MAEYALSAAVVSDFARRKCSCDEHDAYPFWAELLDRVGPAFPFIIRKECLQGIPYGDLGLPDIGRGELVAQPGEMWVLFCFRKALQDSFHPEAAIREAGFPLILEWRKDSQDSPLLSGSFHKLADLVRNQQKASGWGLHPAYGRYGDKVEFTDPLLFSDQEDLAQVSSSYGALSAGLYCAVHEKHPPEWTFPSLQWDGGAKGISGVAGIEEKIFVAAEYGAKYITVAATQKKEAESILRRLKTTNPQRFRGLSVVGTRSRGSLEGLAKAIAFEPLGRKRFVKYVAIGLGFVVAMVGAFVFDSTRSLSRYYAAYVDHYGLPEGLYEIPANRLAQRADETFRFDYSGVHWGNEGNSIHQRWQVKSWFGMPRRLVRMVCVNSRNVPTRVNRDDFENTPTILEFDYSLNSGNVSKVKCRKRGGEDFVRGAVEKVLEFGNRADGEVNTVVETKLNNSPYWHYALTKTTDSKAFEDTGLSEHSCICKYILFRDELGRVKRKFFCDFEGYGVLDGDGVGGIEYEYSDDGMIRQLRFLGKFDANSPMQAEYVVDCHGVSIHRYGHVGGNLCEFSYYNGWTNLVIGPCGVALGRITLDSDGNMRILRMFDENEKPVNALFDMRGGGVLYSEVHLEISNGLHAVCDYRALDDDGKIQTVQVMRTEFDAEGDPIAKSWYDANDVHDLSNGGSQYERVEYDRLLGLPTRIRYYGSDGRTPCYAKVDGIVAAGRDIKYDADGNEIEVCYVDCDGLPMRNEEGWVFKRWRFKDSRPIEVAYFDEKTNFVSCIAGYACARMGYEHGNIRSMRLYKNDGSGNLEPTQNKVNVHKYEWMYDNRGRKNLVLYKDVKDEPCKEQELGCFGKAYVYLPLLKGSTYGFQTNVLVHGGEERRTIYLDRDGKTSFRMKSGYAEERSVYDERDNLLLISTHDERGVMVPAYGSVVAAYECAYNRRGQKTEITKWDKNGERCAGVKNVEETPASVHRAEIGYNSRGLMAWRRYYNVKNEPTAQNGHHEERFTYDKMGREKSISYWGCNKEPALDGQKIHLEITSHNERGDIIEKAFYGVGGTNDPVVCKALGAWKVTNVYDSKGNCNARFCYGTDGLLLHGDSTAASTKMMYDDLNRTTKISYFDNLDHPAGDDNNCVQMTCMYVGNSSLLKSVTYHADENSEIGPFFLPDVARIVMGKDSFYDGFVDTRFRDGVEIYDGVVTMIRSVKMGTAASRKGLRAGDLILAVNEFSDSFKCNFSEALQTMIKQKKQLLVARCSPSGYKVERMSFDAGPIGVFSIYGVKISCETHDKLVELMKLCL